MQYLKNISKEHATRLKVLGICLHARWSSGDILVWYTHQHKHTYQHTWVACLFIDPTAQNYFVPQAFRSHMFGMVGYKRSGSIRINSTVA